MKPADRQTEDLWTWPRGLHQLFHPLRQGSCIVWWFLGTEESIDGVRGYPPSSPHPHRPTFFLGDPFGSDGTGERQGDILLRCR